MAHAMGATLMGMQKLLCKIRNCGLQFVCWTTILCPYKHLQQSWINITSLCCVSTIKYNDKTVILWYNTTIGHCDRTRMLVLPRLHSLPDWLFWSQNAEIWLLWDALGSKLFVWLFGYFLAHLQLLHSTNFSWRRVASSVCILFLPPWNEKWASMQWHNAHPGLPKERQRRGGSETRHLSHAVSSESVPAVHCIVHSRSSRVPICFFEDFEILSDFPLFFSQILKIWLFLTLWAFFKSKIPRQNLAFFGQKACMSCLLIFITNLYSSDKSLSIIMVGSAARELHAARQHALCSSSSWIAVSQIDSKLSPHIWCLTLMQITAVRLPEI